MVTGVNGPVPGASPGGEVSARLMELIGRLLVCVSLLDVVSVSWGVVGDDLLPAVA